MKIKTCKIGVIAISLLTCLGLAAVGAQEERRPSLPNTGMADHFALLLRVSRNCLHGNEKKYGGHREKDLQFGDGLMRRPTAVECDLLRGLNITDRFLEEAYAGRFIQILTHQEIDSLALLIDRAVEIAPLNIHFDIGFIDSPG